MNRFQQSLYERIRQFSFDEGGEQQTFAQRLAKENNWTPVFSARAIEEYRRFMFLAVAAGHPVTPSDPVDQVWHLHLAYTRSYWDRWCPEVLQSQVHHGPTKGGAAEGRKFRDWYENTLVSYRRLFGEDPPSDIWPETADRFGDDHYERVNTRQNWVIRKPSLLSRKLLLTPLVGLPFAAGFGGASVFAEGTSAGLFIASAIVALILLVCWACSRNRGGGGCSSSGCASCGTSGCSADSGCSGGGCGGGCGGGGD